MKKSRYEAALEAVKLGRACLLGYFGKISHIESKEKAGLVSEADRECEKIIQDYLSLHCPEVGFLGEEQAHLENTELVRNYKGARWILDPLDGTTNYIHQFPIYCISLALEVDGILEIGIIDMPMLNQTWVAQRGQGAFCDGKKISVSKTTEFSDSLLATGFFGEDPDLLDDQIKIFSMLVTKARGIRRPGAAAYDLACVSSGIFDLFWEKNLKPWDTAAGQLLIEEAGGVVKTYEGSPHDPFEKSIVAGNKILVEKFLAEIAKLKLARN
ncbi:inositol monophosphatase [bacterium]|nr:inositol monophosphatase [bacterium]